LAAAAKAKRDAQEALKLDIRQTLDRQMAEHAQNRQARIEEMRDYARQQNELAAQKLVCAAVYFVFHFV
jgi:hypothetical protein